MRTDLEDKGRAKATIGEYETALRRVREFEKSLETRLTISEWTPILLHALKTYLRAVGLSKLRVDKTVGIVQQILSHAEKSWTIERAAKVSVKRTSVGPRWEWSLEEIRRLYAACDAATWPEGPWAVLQWRLFITLLYSTGCRTQDLWRYEDRGCKTPPLRWCDVNWIETTELFGRSYFSQFGWITIRPRKTPDKVIVLPMSQEVRRLMYRVSAINKKEKVSEPIFNCPFSRSKTIGFYAQWWKLVKAAGLEPGIDNHGDRITHRPKDFRTTAASVHNRNIGADAAYITGHSWPSGDIFHRHYVVPVERICESMSKLPRVGV